MEKKKKNKQKDETRYLLHKCAIQLNEYFKNQRSFHFVEIKNTLLTKKKFLKKKPPKRL